MSEINETIERSRIAEEVSLSVNEHVSSLSVLDASNIATVYENPKLITNFTPTLICKTLAIPSESQIIDGVLQIINFDDLLGMFANAFIPLTNIRYSKIAYITIIDRQLIKKSTERNVFLTDNAIKGTTGSKWANNDVEVSKTIISNASDFMTRGGIKSDIEALKNEALTNKTVLLSTYTKMGELFLRAADHIRTSLSCNFTDSDGDIEVDIRYHSFYGRVSTKTAFKFYGYEIESYDTLFNDAPEDRTFVGWSTSTSPENKVATYIPGRIAIFNNSVDLYPVFANKYSVTYHPNSLTIANSELSTQYFDTGYKYEISAIGNSSDNTKPLKVKPNVNTSDFSGYTVRKGGNVNFNVGNVIPIDEDYNFWPCFKDKSIPVGKEISWHSSKKKSTTQSTDPAQTISVINVDFLTYSQIRFDFRCWINENAQTHPLNLYITVKQGDTAIINNNRPFFTYVNHNTPPGVSKTPPSNWKEDSAPSGFRADSGWINLNGKSNNIVVSIQVVETHRNEFSSSDGTLCLKNVFLRA